MQHQQDASAIQAENCLLINNAIAIYNDQCSTGSEIYPTVKKLYNY